MSMIIQPTSRRGFLTGMASLFAAPAIVSAQNLMPIKVLPFEPYMLVRGISLVNGEWTETKIMEAAGDPFAFLSEDFYRRFGHATNLMFMEGLQTAAIESREDEKVMRMFTHRDPTSFRLEHDHAPFVVQVKNPTYGHEEKFYVAVPPENDFFYANPNRKA